MELWHFPILELMMLISIWPSPRASWKASMHLQSSFDKTKHFTASNKPCNIGTMLSISSFATMCSQSSWLTLSTISTPIVFWWFCTLTATWCCTRKTLPKLQLKFRPRSQAHSRSLILITQNHSSGSKSANGTQFQHYPPLARMPSSQQFSHHSICCECTLYQLWWIIMWSSIWPRIGGRQKYKMSMATR